MRQEGYVTIMQSQLKIETEVQITVIGQSWSANAEWGQARPEISRLPAKNVDISFKFKPQKLSPLPIEIMKRPEEIWYQ